MVHQSQTRLFPENNPLAQYHGDLNGDSDAEGRRPSHVVLKTSTTNGYIPLWEDSDTFTEEQLEYFHKLGADMRQVLYETQVRYNGGDHKGTSTVSIVFVVHSALYFSSRSVRSLFQVQPMLNLSGTKRPILIELMLGSSSFVLMFERMHSPSRGCAM